jgi:hypothetical protein
MATQFSPSASFSASSSSMKTLFENFPYLIPRDSKFQDFEGFISIQGFDYAFRIFLPNSPALNGGIVELGPDLHNLLKEHLEGVKKRWSQSKNLSEFLLEFRELIEKVSTERSRRPPVPFYSRLISEMDLLGWNRLHWANSQLTELHLL